MEKVLLELYNPKSQYFASAQFPVENRTSFFKSVEPSFLSTKLYKENNKKQKDIEDSGQNKLFGIGRLGSPGVGDITEAPKVLERSDQHPRGLFVASNVPYKLKNSSVRTLYDELRDIEVASFPNATHDLLRSFLECGLAEYLTQIDEYLKVQKNDLHNPKLGEMLTHIISNRIIDDQHILDNLGDIKSDWDKPYSLERMNKVNHNKDYASAESDVRVAWGKLESFFKVILNPKKQK
jgi:hypothetical protein